MDCDYFKLITQTKYNGASIVLTPSFKLKARDIVTKGTGFYAVYNPENKLWSRDEEDVITQVDNEMYEYLKVNSHVTPCFMNDSESQSWLHYKKYIQSKPQSSIQFDSKLLFSDHELKREDYATRTLSYFPKQGNTESFNKILNTLYDKVEVDKIKWFIGALLTGDSAYIQKFAVFFGPPGSGKSTVINIVEDLVEGYAASFIAKDLVGSNNQFGTAPFKSNPILAIQHDGDLSRIEDNSILNQLVSHETTLLNEKFKGQYEFKFNGLIILGTNKPVKITDSKSGMLRRILDIIPSGITLPYEEYVVLVERVKFEKAAIAYECIQVYNEMGIAYYKNHRPFKMMELTDFFYDFVLEYLHVLKNGITLKHATELYAQYCEDNKLDVKSIKQKVRSQIEDYFLGYAVRKKINGVDVRDYYYDFDETKITAVKYESEDGTTMSMTSPISYLDNYAVDYQAQYATSDVNETPLQPWDKVLTTLKDIETSKVHYIRPPENHIVIDFDLKDADGNKDMLRNIQAATKFPATYGEFSKSGNGVHLHYIYEGDISELSPLFSEDIEVKVFVGKASLRRRFTYSNGINIIATIAAGCLPLKEKGNSMYENNKDMIWNEKKIRSAIKKALNKEHHGHTGPEIDFIVKVLKDAHETNTVFDVRDLRPAVLKFAMQSTNQKQKCLSKVSEMSFSSVQEKYIDEKGTIVPDEDLVFFDIEVFPNLFLVVFKKYRQEKVYWFNPTPQQIETLLTYNLIGFNCRRYDNHMLYGCLLGKSNIELYQLSKSLIGSSPNAFYANAYNFSYADIYEYASNKQSLKKYEIEMGILHDEFEYDWDKPLPKDKWERVGIYCGNDVDATEETFDYTKSDYVARQILCALTGLSMNTKTQTHAEKFIFGDDPKPQEKFIYHDLSEDFPGYTYSYGKSEYRGENPSEGGYVYSEPGLYSDVALLDIASMHPSSLIAMNHFGPYTYKFAELKQVRLYIKHGEFEKARDMFDGILKPYLNDKKSAKELSYALKIIINIVYGMTSAKFENKFRQKENNDNIVAKRGALFMIDLKHAVQEQGYTVAHIKTDSIKIPNADKFIIDFVMEFGRKFDYDFEHEHTYKKFGLVNKAVYIAQLEDDSWEATGSQFAHPYVFKKLFSHEEIDIPKDIVEVKSVKDAAIYIDDIFIGKNAQVIAVNTDRGKQLYRVRDSKRTFVAGTKSYKWVTLGEFKFMQYEEEQVDFNYLDKLVTSALTNLANVGDVWNMININDVDEKYRLEEFEYECV